MGNKKKDISKCCYPDCFHCAYPDCVISTMPKKTKEVNYPSPKGNGLVKAHG